VALTLHRIPIAGKVRQTPDKFDGEWAPLLTWNTIVSRGKRTSLTTFHARRFAANAVGVLQ